MNVFDMLTPLIVIIGIVVLGNVFDKKKPVAKRYPMGANIPPEAPEELTVSEENLWRYQVPPGYQPEVEESAEVAEESTAVASTAVASTAAQPTWSDEELAKAIVWREILGEPRSRRYIRR